MRLYGIKACDTCRKALKTLQNAGVEVTFQDIRETPLMPEQVDRFLDAFGEKLVNTRSTTWRGLDDETRARDPKSLLIDHPTLMKRPVIESEKGLTLGWTKDVQARYS